MDIDKLQKYRLLYHILFWVTFILLFSGFLSVKFSFYKSFEIITLTVLSYMPAVYINLLYLIPNILIRNRQFKQYVLYVFLTVLISVPLVALVSYYTDYDPTKEYSILMLLIFSFINTLFMVVLVSGLKFMKDYFIQQQKTMELQKQSLVSELRFLKSQINPHFLFNTLNNIYALTLKNDVTAPEAVLKLSELMRYILYECNEREVALTKEIQCIKNYIDLERLRQGEGSNIQIHIDGRPEEYTIAPLLFIPFLENSFKHGLNSQITDSWVKIDIRINDQYLNMSISNSKGLTKVPEKKSGGIGLKNVKRRLDLLYPKNHHLEIEDTEDLYKVELTLQLKHKKITNEAQVADSVKRTASNLRVNLN